jgi:hypothetical protein
VYSMYPWDRIGASDSEAPVRPAHPAHPAQTAAGGDSPLPPSHELASALQLALDRRDNGGDATRHRRH